MSSPSSWPSAACAREASFLALEKLREDAGVGIPLQNGPRLGEHRPSSGSIATHGVYLG